MKHEGFKTCDRSGFCKRNRAFADNAATIGSAWASPYNVAPESVKIDHGQIIGAVEKTLGDEVKSKALFPFKVTFLESGAARVTVDELKRQRKDIELRHGSQARKERYNEASSWALVTDGTPDALVKGDITKEEAIVQYGPSNQYKAVIRYTPFSIDFIKEDEVQVRFNGRGLLNMEHWRPKVEKVTESNESEESEGSKDGEKPAAPEKSAAQEEDESTWWEETFGGNTDSKPKGPESVGLDITFPGYEHVYGIPGHASSLSLKQTRYVLPGRVAITTD